MQVTYASHHRWQRTTTTDPLSSFSARTAGKIRTALAHLEAANIHYEIAPLTQSFLDLFIPLYTEHIEKKDNAIVHDVLQKTLGNTASNHPYFAFSLYEGGTFIGGTIFSLRPDRISFAYRIFQPRWNHADIKITPAYIGEYATAVFAQEHNLPFISHGRDRNPYGLNAAIGLATFKLSAGCHASVESNPVIHTVDTETIDTDALILALPTSGIRITNAYLVTTKANAEKHLQVTKYPDLLEVEVLYRD